MGDDEEQFSHDEVGLVEAYGNALVCLYFQPFSEDNLT